MHSGNKQVHNDDVEASRYGAGEQHLARQASARARARWLGGGGGRESVLPVMRERKMLRRLRRCALAERWTHELTLKVADQ